MTDKNKIPYKIYLEESEMPKAWYNLRADMINKPAPLLNPETLEPMTAYERKIIHTKLQNHPKVKTFSKGEEPYRKVVITLK